MKITYTTTTISPACTPVHNILTVTVSDEAFRNGDTVYYNTTTPQGYPIYIAIDTRDILNIVSINH